MTIKGFRAMGSKASPFVAGASAMESPPTRLFSFLANVIFASEHHPCGFSALVSFAALPSQGRKTIHRIHPSTHPPIPSPLTRCCSLSSLLLDLLLLLLLLLRDLITHPRPAHSLFEEHLRYPPILYRHRSVVSPSLELPPHHHLQLGWFLLSTTPTNSRGIPNHCLKRRSPLVASLSTLYRYG